MSREVDKEIAEKVFGLGVQKDKVTAHCFAEKKDSDREDYFIGDSNNIIPHYSTDLASAWLLVDKLKLLDDYYLASDGLWEYPDDPIYFSLGKEPIPMIICKAALKLIELEKV